MNVVSFLKRGCKEQKVSGQKIIVETEAGQAEASQFRSPKMVAVGAAGVVRDKPSGTILLGMIGCVRPAKHGVPLQERRAGRTPRHLAGAARSA